MLGTIVNTIAVILGGLTGLIINKKLPAKYNEAVFQVLGLFTIVLAVSMGIKSEKILVLVFSLLLGTLFGGYFNLQQKLEDLIGKFQSRINKNKEKENSSVEFINGFVTAFLLFCMGSLTILGAIEEGLGKSNDLLMVKSLMDGFSAIALTTSFGIGVIFSALPLFIYQGGLTYLAFFVKDFLSEAVIVELSACGGVILLALGLNILNLTKFKVVNFLPALVLNLIFNLIIM